MSRWHKSRQRTDGTVCKAGKNVIGFTASADASATFQIGYNAMLTLNCGNNLLRGQSLTLDAKTTYPDAYYTVDRYFTVPEDGTYTFINHGAKGTILNIGKVKMTDPDNQYAYECDWSDIQSATVGNDDATIVVSGLTAGEKVLVQSDAFGVIGEGSDNRPYLMVVKGGSTGISDIKADNSTQGQRSQRPSQRRERTSHQALKLPSTISWPARWLRQLQPKVLKALK